MESPKDRNSKCNTCYGLASLQELFYWVSVIPLCRKWHPHILQMKKSSILNLSKSLNWSGCEPRITWCSVTGCFYSRIDCPDQSWLFLPISNGKMFGWEGHRKCPWMHKGEIIWLTVKSQHKKSHGFPSFIISQILKNWLCAIQTAKQKSHIKSSLPRVS